MSKADAQDQRHGVLLFRGVLSPHVITAAVYLLVYIALFSGDYFAPAVPITPAGYLVYNILFIEHTAVSEGDTHKLTNSLNLGVIYVAGRVTALWTHIR